MKNGIFLQEGRVNNGFPSVRGESQQWVSVFKRVE